MVGGRLREPLTQMTPRNRSCSLGRLRPGSSESSPVFGCAPKLYGHLRSSAHFAIKSTFWSLQFLWGPWAHATSHPLPSSRSGCPASQAAIHRALAPPQDSGTQPPSYANTL